MLVRKIGEVGEMRMRYWFSWLDRHISLRQFYSFSENMENEAGGLHKMLVGLYVRFKGIAGLRSNRSFKGPHRRYIM
jgi:hypothetical protein